MLFSEKQRLSKNNGIRILSIFIITFVFAFFILIIFLVFFRLSNKQVIKISDFEQKSTNELSVPPINNSDNYIGNLGAAVQVIIYSDFECSACLKFQETIKSIIAEFPSQTIIAFRNFPLRIHQSARLAALVAECAGEQGKFWEMHDQLFVDNGNNNFNENQFKRDAENLRLDIKQFEECVAQQKYGYLIEKERSEAIKNGAEGTPAVFINGILYSGARPFEDFVGSDGTTKEGIKSIIIKNIKP